MAGILNYESLTTLKRTQQYLRHRITGIRCERDEIDAWRRFYRTNEPLVRLMVSKAEVAEEFVVPCVEGVWLEILACLPKMQTPVTNDAFVYWLNQIVRKQSQRYRRNTHATSADTTSPESDRRNDAFSTAALTSGEEVHCLDSNSINDRLLQLCLVEDQPIERVARTLGMTCQQAIDRQYHLLKRILSILIQFDAMPAR